MELKLTKEQLRTLSLLTYIGNWVVNADREINEQNDACNDVEQLILGACLKAGFDELVDEESPGEFSSSVELEDEAETYLDEYERNFLLEDLAIQLARRDLSEKVGAKEVVKLSPEVYAAKLNPLIEEYMEEFNENGVGNVRIIQGKKG